MFRMNMEGTKWTIFEVAVDLFAEQGYSNVSIRDIAATAKIRPSSIYYHFKSKNEILEGIIEYYDYYYNLYLPPLDQILPYIEREAPEKVLGRMIFRYNPELNDIMDKVFMIVTIESFSGNEQAQAVLEKNTYDTPKLYIQTILTRMMELGKIDIVNINACTLIFSCLTHSCALRMHASHPVSWDEVMESVDMLFGMFSRKT